MDGNSEKQKYTFYGILDVEAYIRPVRQEDSAIIDWKKTHQDLQNNQRQSKKTLSN